MDEVRAVLDAELPGSEIESLDPVQHGNTKHTVIADLGTRSVVVQFAPYEKLRIERNLSAAVRRRTSVPTPRVLGIGRIDDRGYLVAERAPGTELHERFNAIDDATRRRIARRFGRFLAEIHAAFRFEGYGPIELSDDGGAFVATDQREWTAWFRGYAAEGIDALPSELDSLRDRIETALADASIPSDPDPRLYPWDLRPGNALYADGTVSAVLDWDGPLSADPGLSVAKTEHLVAEWYTEESLSSAFRSGYETIRPLPETPPTYRLVAVVRSAVDASGQITRPGYPERTGEAAVAFHRDRIESILARV
ncbi:MAG: phosphotransferase [Natronomonas sp.]